MNLLELAVRYPQRAEGGVPDWMLGHFRRRTISFADGRSDERTQVHCARGLNILAHRCNEVHDGAYQRRR